MKNLWSSFLGIVIITIIIISCEKRGNNDQAGIPTLSTGSLQPMPSEWIDMDTRHRIKRIGRKGAENKSFYFHNNPFLPGLNGQADQMVYYSKAGEQWQLFVVNLETLESEQLTNSDNRIFGEIVSPVSRKAYYQTGDSVFAVNIDSKINQLVYRFPEDFRGSIRTVNSNATLLAGSYAEPLKDSIYKAHPDKSSYFDLIYEAKIPHTLFTIDLVTGELNKIHHERAWINHEQFSPTDPDLLSYCHEGPWHKVDRMWTIDVTTGVNQVMHKRTMDMEIAGHEFFSRDGKTIWYDLQKPKSVNFFLAGVDVETLEKKTYQMHKDQWSIHFNISPDQQTFAGDGGDSTQVAHSKNAQWIYHFTPSGDTLLSEKLVNMRTHHYRPLEPNVHFTPDGEWMIFRSDLDGEIDVYAVELSK